MCLLYTCTSDKFHIELAGACKHIQHIDIYMLHPYGVHTVTSLSGTATYM